MGIAGSQHVLKKGNIVEIVVSDDEHLRGCRGEVITENPLTVAVLHVLPLEANQLRKIFDATDSTKAELADEADKLGINVKSKDTLDEIAAKIKDLHQHEGCIECEVGEAGRGNTVAESATFTADSASVLPSASPAAASASPEVPSPSGGGVSTLSASVNIVAGDCVKILKFEFEKNGLKFHPNGRVCKVFEDSNPVVYAVTLFNQANERKKFPLVWEDLQKLNECPIGDDAPPLCR